jgi:hypothetical protein
MHSYRLANSNALLLDGSQELGASRYLYWVREDGAPQSLTAGCAGEYNRREQSKGFRADLLLARPCARSGGNSLGRNSANRESKRWTCR